MKNIKEINLTHKNKKIKIKAKKISFCLKFIGLMFKRRENAQNLLFYSKKDTCFAIHSFFVFFDFLAIWTDKNYNVIEIKKVKPWQFYVDCNKKFRHLIEIPINKKNKFVIKKLLEY